MPRPISLFIVSFLISLPIFSQSPVFVRETPEQAQKLFELAAQIEPDAPAANWKRAWGGAARIPSGAQNSANAPEQVIEQRSQSNNGIYVDEPKVYDDSLLQQMLSSAQSRLAALQGFDQGSITRAIGNVTGASQQVSSVGLAGGVQPPTVTTSTSTTSSPFPVPAAVAPTPSTTLPTSNAPSAADILNEQTQLNSDIANLRLLLEGSLSDQIMVLPGETFAKPRVTLGFPVVITPNRHDKNAVAIVEVMVDTAEDNDASPNGEAPSITALLPREKTYNVAAITDRSVGLGAGFATAMAGASASVLWGHKQYFIVKDQDTLAVQFDPSEPELATLQSQGVKKERVRAFAWQFRPVLGRPFVQAGSRQVFVQLAFPGRGAGVKSFGNVRIRTYWRKIDHKTGVLKRVVAGSVHEEHISPIPNYEMRQRYVAASFSPNSMEDLGGGKMLVELKGRLLPGTYLRVGSNIIQPGAGSVPSDLKTTRFLANIADLATLDTFVISRDGTEIPLKIKPGAINNFRVDQAHVRVTQLDDATSLLEVPITNFITSQDIPPVLLIGGKVFGYSDAPIDRKCNAAAGTCVLSVALPTALLVSSPTISAKALMLDEDGLQTPLKANRTFTLFPQSLMHERLVFLAHDATTATYLVYGHDLNQARIIWPARNADITCPPNQLCLQPISTAADDGSLKLIKLPLDFATAGSPLILQRPAPGDRPFLLSVPAPPADPSTAPKKVDPKFKERIVVGADEASIVGDGLDAITAVTFAGKPLTIASRSASSIRLTGLAAAGASAVAKTQDISLVTLAGSSKIPLEVVSVKVEVIQK